MGILRSDVISHSQLESTGGSIVLDGVGDYLTFAASGAFSPATSDVTFELWFYLTDDSDFSSGSGNYYFFDMGSNGYRIQMYEGLIRFGIDGSTWTPPASGVSKSVWHHAAGVRQGNSLDLYLDGNHVGQKSTTASVTSTSLTIGNYGGAPYDGEPYGYISNFRFVKGVVYDKPFTPPKFELKNIAGTIVLGCQSSSSATDFAVTPSAITAQGNAAASSFHPDLKKDNTDTGVVFEDNTKFDTLSYMVPPRGTTTERGRGRGFRFGGDSPSKANHIEFVNIQSQGTAQDFGDLLTTLTQAHAGSSSIRSIIFAGYNAPANVADIQCITNATQGNSIDAGINVGGDFTRYVNVVSNEVRSVYGGGSPGYTATMEYVTNASLSSVTDFGDFSAGGMYSAATMNSSTRGIFAGGYYNPGGGATQLNTIQYITIMTTGNSQDFGDLVANSGGPHGICSSPTRGIAWAGGNTIQYLTIPTLGNAADFGDARSTGFNSGVSFSSHTRGVAGGGYNNPGSGNNNQKYMNYVTISTTGNASDFGDLRTIGSSMGGSSDCHGGIS